MRKARVRVANFSELPEDCGKIVSLGEKDGECALFRHQDRCYAVGSLCPHQNAPLEGAPASQGVVTCRRHGYRFDLRTGDCLTIGGYGVPVYATDIEGDSVFVTYWQYEDEAKA